MSLYETYFKISRLIKKEGVRCGPTKVVVSCVFPRFCCFAPKSEDADAVALGLAVFEAMRLVDVEGFSQDEAAQCMEVSLPTLCRGRPIVREALVQGNGICLTGKSSRKEAPLKKRMLLQEKERKKSAGTRILLLA